jgi:hypothetical protein
LHGLGCEEVADPPRPELAAVPGVAKAAERGRGVEPAPVHLNLTRADPPRDVSGAPLIVSPDPGGQPVAGVVGDRQGVVHIPVGLHDQHGPEDLVSRDGTVPLGAGEHRRPDVIAGAQTVRGLGTAVD